MTAADGWLDDALACVRRACVVVFGDFALDAYWTTDPGESERSVETGLAVRRVREQRYGLGGAGNVAANAVDLGAAAVAAVGVIGDDPFGRELLAQLQHRRVDTAGILPGPAGWQTAVYAKPHVDGVEQHRIDFGSFDELPDEWADRLAERLDAAAARADVVVLNQQISPGVATDAMIARLRDVVADHPDCTFLADSRDRPAAFGGCALKINLIEAAHLLGADLPEEPAPAVIETLARELSRRVADTVFVTAGQRGIVVASAGETRWVPGHPVTGPTDPVGAGDTAAAALAGVLGGGGAPTTAARLANAAAAVTVTKLRTTGTATPDEIRQMLTASGTRRP